MLGISLCSCTDGTPQPEQFNFEKAVGLWQPYEIINRDGSIFSGPFTSGIFGAYSESFELQANGTYVPVNCQNGSEFQYSVGEVGDCRYEEESSLLFFDGAFNLEYEILKFQENELWLKNSSGTLKLRKYKK